jgi:ABC-type phosphate/phosphonate transport system substrate-binding protein
MYDWPEVRAATDRLWSCLRDALRAEGVAAPEALARDAGHDAHWLDPGLVLGQTCGYPLVARLAGRVAVLGAADYGIEGCPPGFYRSLVVAREADRRPDLAAFRGARLAVNGYASQSGFWAILHHAAPLARDGLFFGDILFTGSHDASARAVAEGRADLAALDAVSFRLIRRFRPWAGELRTLFMTEPTPGLPLIAASATEPAPHRRALARGFAALDPEARAALGLRGFVPLDLADYAPVRTRARAAARLLRLPEGAAAPPAPPPG